MRDDTIKPDIAVCDSIFLLMFIIVIVIIFFYPSYHTTHTTQAERRAQESPRRQRRQRVARRPKVASREKNLYIYLFFRICIRVFRGWYAGRPPFIWGVG